MVAHCCFYARYGYCAKGRDRKGRRVSPPPRRYPRSARSHKDRVYKGGSGRPRATRSRAPSPDREGFRPYKWPGHHGGTVCRSIPFGICVPLPLADGLLRLL